MWATSLPILVFLGLSVLDLKVKVKVHTLDIASLRSESPPQKRSGMARVLEGLQSIICTPTHLSAIRMSHTCLCLPSRSWYSFSDPGAGLISGLEMEAVWSPPLPFLSLPFPSNPSLPSVPSPPLPSPSLRSMPLKSMLGRLGSAVSSPSGVWGGVPAEIEFGAF